MRGRRMLCGAWMLAMLGVAACSNVRAESAPANAEAQRYGVYAYELSPTSVTLLAREGLPLGVLRVTAPEAGLRQLDIEYQDGARYTNEISWPVDGHFRAPVLETREGFILGDAALAPFFAAYDLEFVVEPEVAVEREIAAAGLGPAETSFDACHSLTWPSACTQCPQNSLHRCTYSHIAYGKVAHGFAYCPPLPSHDCITDIVAKDRICYHGGSCSQHSVGFITCGFGAPNPCGHDDDSD